MAWILMITILFNLNYLIKVNANNNCEDWISFKNEKCFKLLDSVISHDNALKQCKSLSSSSSLASILSEEEQQFLENYIFTENHSVDSVWIGAMRTNLSKYKFVWEDGEDLIYNNWEDSSFDQLGNNCVEMQAKIGFDLTNKLGKWIQVSCDKKNLVLCQTKQNWTEEQMQSTLKQIKRELEYLKINMTSTQTNSIVPIGFIYFQLPSQPEPSSLWPKVNWTDISSSYAGLFFRVLGNSSASFGRVQEENSPHLVDIYRDYGSPSTPSYWGSTLNYYTSTQTYQDVLTTRSVDNLCYSYCNSYTTLNFRFKTGEVIPRNQAIRVWRRTA